MKIAIIGSGAIGGLVAAYLKLKGADVTLVGHSNSIKTIAAGGLEISGVRGKFQVNLPVAEKLSENFDLVILATKTQDIDTAVRNNLYFLKESLVLTTQNGLQADELAAKYIPKENIVSSIVMFGATYLEPGKIVHNFEGNWIMGSIFGASPDEIAQAKEAGGKAFTVIVTDRIKGMKYLKVFVNANNCIAAILGISMQEAFSDIEVSKIAIAIWKEGLEIARKAKVELVSLPDFPLERLENLAAMPIQGAAQVFSGIISNLSNEPVYGSILQSIKRSRESEIDYLNGEFINLARNNNMSAPLNEKLVEMVHRVEKTRKFFSKDELIQDTKGLFN